MAIFVSCWRASSAMWLYMLSVSPRLTLKGLRHTVAAIFRGVGKSAAEVACMLGQPTKKMARHYSRRAGMVCRNTAVVKDFEAEVNRRHTKVVRPRQKSVKPTGLNKC